MLPCLDEPAYKATFDITISVRHLALACAPTLPNAQNVQRVSANLGLTFWCDIGVENTSTFTPAPSSYSCFRALHLN